jgi:Bacterial Ig-like domain (group 3)
VSGHVTLTQIGASQTVLAVGAPSAASNQAVGILAVVSAASGQVSGTVTFENGGVPLPGCANEPVSGSNLSASCSAAFGAGSPQLAAVFTPASGSAIAGSTGTASLTVTRDATSTALRLSSPALTVGTNETYQAVVTPAHAGSLTPTGSVSFLDGGKPITGCQSVPVQRAGGSATAACATAYTASGSHAISAVYSGDGNFADSSSGSTTVPVSFLGTLGAAVRWSFVTAASYSKVLSLSVTGAAGGSTIVVSCHGGGCPFATRRLPVASPKSCAGKSACTATTTVGLTPRFAQHRLRPGTKITVDIVRPGWIGKAYTFTIRAPHTPRMTEQADPTNFILP